MEKWKRISWDNEQQIEFKNGRKFKVKKQLNANEQHDGSWQVWEEVNHEWEWIDNYSPMWFAKENVMNWNK
jgi:hypothetical protein